MKTSHKPPFLSNLNQFQLEAAMHIDGPLLILAGAGTGKTKVLTSRIANIILEKAAFSSEILAVTFTNKASKEMMERVNNITDSEGIWLGTFHSIGAKILRRHAELVGLSSNFNIIDYDDQNKLVKNILKEHNIDDKQITSKNVLAVIQKWKDLGLTQNKLSDADVNNVTNHVARKVYIDYQHKLRSSNIVDFGDLLLYNIEIFNKYYDILHIYQKKFKYILVDEYQDTNVLQYLWLRLLAATHKNICCVGDDDQSIYSWRGAEIGNILKFEGDFPGSKIIRLEQNYRSTSNILKAASNLISKNHNRFKKVLWTEGDAGKKVQINSLWDEREEASHVANVIESKKHQYNHLDMAILVRAGFQTRIFEECFISRMIPYRIIGGQRFYERREIKDIISYIRLIMAHDDDLAFERIINIPKRNIGKTSLDEIKIHAKDQRLSLFESAKEMIGKKILTKKIESSLNEFIKNIENWQLKFSLRDHSEVVDIILRESGYIESLRLENNLEAETRIENLNELTNAVKEFNNITEFLEHISLISDYDDKSEKNQNNVNIMTLHAAKGLEFRMVFLPGWEEGLFPHQKSMEENNISGLEEERRLAYVGITRAREELYISHAANRRIFNQWQNSVVSRFIAEIGEEACEFSENQLLKRLSNVQKNFVKNHDIGRRAEQTKPERKTQLSGAKEFAKKDRIFHKIFGYGEIVSVSEENAEVFFQNLGVKRMALSYLEKKEK